MDANLLNKIQDLAKQACKDGETLPRAILADKLDVEGGDSQKVAELVSEAWEALGKPDEIARAFVSNDGRNALVEAQRLPQMLREGDVDGVGSFIRHSLNFAHDSLGILDDKLYAEIQNVAETTTTLRQKFNNFMSRINGTRGIEKSEKQITAMFMYYKEVVEAYHSSRVNVRGVIDDFITLRGDIVSTYHEFAMRLVDIFGDSIKAIDPKLFDFENVQWLDVDARLENVSQEYARLSELSGSLRYQINESFDAMTKGIENDWKSYQDPVLVSINAVASGLDHYRKAKEQENLMRMKVEKFRTYVENDANLIKTDKGRLLAIYTTLNNLLIPKAMTFLRFVGQLMEQDVNSIISSLYDNPQVKPLEEDRRRIVEELRRVDAQIVDLRLQIAPCSTKMNELKESLKARRVQFIRTKANEPQKPWWLYNIIFLGVPESNYRRKHDKWYSWPFIHKFEKDLGLLRSYEKCADDYGFAERRLCHEREELVKALNGRSKSIRSLISASPEAKQRLLGNLRPLVAMLRLGREIAESKLDPQLINTTEVFVEPQTAYGLQLTPELEEGVANFKQSLEQKGPLGHLVASGISLAQSFAQLNAAMRQGVIDRKNYDQECEKIRENLRTYLAQVDDKSDFLREVMRKANLADTPEERKDALMLMSEVGGLKLSDDEFEDFLSGNRSIEL